MIKRNITVRTLAGCAAVGLLVAACGGDDDSGQPVADSSEPNEAAAETGDSVATEATEAPEQAPAGERTIQVLTFASPEQMQPVVDAWEARNPDVSIEVQTVPFGDLNAVIRSRVGDGDPEVDVYLVDQPRLASLAADGLLLDITEDVEIPDEAILPDALAATEYEGRLYALPVQTSTQLLFYNPELLEAAGVAIPTTDPADRLTWEETIEAGAAAQEAGASWGVVFEQGATPYQLLPLPQSLGGDAGLTGDDMLTPAFTTEPWIEAATWWRDVHEDGVVPRGMGFGVTTETFAAGDAAFFLAGPWNLGILGGQDLPFEFGVTAHPYFADGQAVTPTGSFGWGVNRSSDVQQDAIDLVAFVATTADGSLAVAEGDPNIPTQTEALDAYLSGELFAGGIGDLIRHELDSTAVVRPVTTGYIEYETILGAALEDIRNGLDPESTLSSAESDLAAALGQ